MSKLRTNTIENSDALGDVKVNRNTTDGDLITLQKDEATVASLGVDAGALTVDVNAAERLRVDATGNVLVGKTAVGTAGAGAYLLPAGQLGITNVNQTSGTAPLVLRRDTQDGMMCAFMKDTTTVGVIGTTGSDVYIGSTDNGVIFTDSVNALIARSPSASGTVIDGQASLGWTNQRWKDLYLSGSVYLGGTTASNALDDYEEGTWTPTISNTTTPASGITYSSRQGSYTKVGDMVTVHCYIRATITSAGSGDPIISGLPFPALTGQTNYYGVSHGINNLLTDTAPNSNFIGGSNAQFGANTWRTGINNYITFTAVYKVA